MADNRNIIQRGRDYIFGRKTTMTEIEERTGGAFAVGNNQQFAAFNSSTDRVLQSVTGRACLEIITKGVSGLTVEVLKKDSNGNLFPTKNAIADIFGFSPNPEMTAHDFLTNLLHDTIVHGEGFARIERNTLGVTTGLYYLPCNAVERLPNKDYKVTVVNEKGYVKAVNFDKDDIFSFKSTRGAGILDTNSNLFEVEQHCFNTVKSFFAKGARITTVISSEKKMSQEQKDHLRAALTTATGSNATATSVVMDGVPVTITKIAVTPAESGVTDVLADTQRAIATAFGVPGGMLNQNVATTFNNAEQQRINLVLQTIEPLVHALEDAINLQLFTPAQRKNLRINFDTAALLKGDAKTQAEVHSIYYHGGILTANDIRKDLGMAPMEGGDVLHTPLNLGDAAEESTEETDTTEDTTTDSNE